MEKNLKPFIEPSNYWTFWLSSCPR